MQTAPDVKKHKRRFLLLLVFAITLQVFSFSPALASPEDVPMATIEIPENEEDLFNLFQAIKEIVLELHSNEVDNETLYQGAIRGLFESLGDPYSQYLDEEQFASLSSSLEGEFSGIGVTIDLIDGNITVVNTFKGSPAEKAGIRAGDIIIGADDVDLRGKVPNDASLILRGDTGTDVKVSVKRPSTGEVLVFSLTRSVISIPSMDFEDLGGGIFYIELSQFTSTTGKTFSAIMDYIRSQEAQGIILDLRNNPGGLLDASVDVAGELVPKGTVVELRRKELKETLVSEKDTIPLPTVVLVNQGTASASEIVAGAVRDRIGGLIIGEQTFGKGCVQTVVPIGQGLGGFKLTIADYYTPAGVLLSGVGLEPDIVVKPDEVVLPASIVYKRSLTQGMIGLDVLALQESLQFLGYEVGPLDGIFGAKTNASAAGFCKERDLAYSGSVDESHINRIKLAVLEKAVDGPDTVLDTATSVLRKWLDTGSWQ